MRRTADIGRAAWRLLVPWPMPRIEISLDSVEPLDAQRTQLRLRRLHEILERQTGALLAIAVLIIGLADMVRTWNRSMEHMGWLVVVAIGAGLAGRIIGKTLVRLRMLFELARLRWKVRKWRLSREATLDPAPLAAPGSTFAPAAMAVRSPLPQPSTLLRASCGCGAVSFTLSSPPSVMGTCHCAACRKSGAGTFVIAKRSAFRLVSGAEAVSSWKTPAPHAQEYCFCTRCGTTLGDINSGEATFRIAAACFDDALGIRNGYHEFVGEKPAWQAICDEAKQFLAQS
jgi:hypothetical protein